jgi:hypothetical protein
MRPVFIFFFLIVYYFGIACSGIPTPFCNTKAERPADMVMKGVVVASGNHSIQLSVIEILSGVESRSIVVIWDGTDFDCNGMVSMKSTLIGLPGDTVLCILPKIQTVQNTWDVIGDYRMPDHLFKTPVLKVLNGFLKGSVAGDMFTWEIRTMPYQDFKNYWIQHQNSCITLVSIASSAGHEPVSVYAYDGLIHFEPESAGGTFRFLIHSADGVRLLEGEFKDRHTVDLKDLPLGIYFISLADFYGRSYAKKIIR